MNEKKTILKVPDFMRLILEDIRLLKSDGNNPNRMTNKMKEELWKSLMEFGWVQPILADKNGVYADGEQRVSVCIMHSEFWAPVFRLDLSDVQRRRLRLEANVLKGKHNRELEQDEWKRIIEAGQKTELESLLLSVGEKLPVDLGGAREGSNMVPETLEMIIDFRDESEQQSLFLKFQDEEIRRMLGLHPWNKARLLNL